VIDRVAAIEQQELKRRDPPHSISLWDENFSQTTDEQVRNLLARLQLGQ
jgi:hypothetical protein